jgi:hypothetical protein
MVLLFMYLFHVSERDVSLEDGCTLFSQGKEKERLYQRRSKWKNLVLVQEAYVFQRKNVPLVNSAPQGDFALYNKTQELNVVTAVRLRHDLIVFLIKTSWIVKCYRPSLLTKI